MKAVATIVAVASAASAVFAQSNLPIIQSPASLVVCQPALLSFSGGTAPYYISVLPGGQSSAAALEQFPVQNGNSYTWNVNLAAGQSVTLSIRDSTGAINYSSELPIQSGSDTSCVGQSLTNSGSSTPGGASTSGASNTGGSTGATSASRTSSAASSSMTSSRASSSAATSNTGASSAAQSSAASSAAPTGAASTKYVANAAGVFGVAAIVAAFA